MRDACRLKAFESKGSWENEELESFKLESYELESLKLESFHLRWKVRIEKNFPTSGRAFQPDFFANFISNFLT